MLVLNVCAGGVSSSASIRVNHRDEIYVTVRRLYVVVRKGQLLDGAYARLLAAALDSELSGHVEAKAAEIVTDMELDPNALPDRMARFRADGILVLKPIGVTLNPYELGIDNPDRYGTLAHDVRYLALLLDAKSGQTIWRAEVLHQGIPSRVQERSALAAQKIVMALHNDHLIR